MDSLSLPTTLERRSIRPGAPTAELNDLVLVVSVAEPAAADYAAYASKSENRNVVVIGDRAVRKLVAKPAATRALEDLSALDLRSDDEKSSGPALILFLNSPMSDGDRRTLAGLMVWAVDVRPRFVGIVSTFRVHLDDAKAAEAESFVLRLAEKLPARIVIFRPGHLLSPNSRPKAWLRRFGSCFPLVPRRICSCFVDGDELFSAIEKENNSSDRHGMRTLTVLGPNRSWRDLLALHCGRSFWNACLTCFSAALSILGIGQILRLFFSILAKRSPRLRAWNFDTLRPRNFQELLALYNPYNYRYVKVVGYNNGVVHFGQRHPGKTIISTVRCDRVRPVGEDLLNVDCGVTVRKARDLLADTGRQLPVVPNYSYVTFGTSMFVPIHGSAADFSTLADTIARVLFYDPVSDRFVAASRDQPTFRELVYNLQAEALILRLCVQTSPKSRYYVQREDRQNPSSEEILGALQDARATNVEIRKAESSKDALTISKYYKDPGDAGSNTLELPRDTLGRLWDRLEENPITSFLMHALTRHLAWHVELFFTAAEFSKFWTGSRGLPLRKIQLRYIRRDQLPHSPFRDHDCVSVDLFMLRWHRHQFEAYLNENFSVIRYNPGKHSG